MKPVIGITSVQNTGNNTYVEEINWVDVDYVYCVEEAGGLPLVIPNLKSAEIFGNVLEVLDALVISGGGDLDPFYYGEDPLPYQGRTEPDRDRLEVALVRLAIERDLPLLGICRGIQVMVAAAGGKLYQDIHKQKAASIQHLQNAPRWHTTHGIAIEAGTILRDIMGTSALRVNSFHHQAAREIPPEFRVSAYAPDGIIEAIESPRHSFTVGVQWHPESLRSKEKSTALLFSATVRAAELAKEKKRSTGR